MTARNPKDGSVATDESPMERRRTGWIRLAVASGATAAGLAALLAGAAFGLQAVTLPRPSQDQLLAAQTLRWLTAQHGIKSTTLVRGQRVSSICVNATIGPLPAYPKRLHASLLVTGHRRLVETRFASFRLGSTVREEDGPLPTIQAVLAGCPRALGRRIGRFLDDRAPIRAERVLRRGMPMLRLSFKHGGSRLILLVDPHTFAPVAVRIPRLRTGWSYLARARLKDLVRPELRLSRRLRLIVKEEA
jgi:hypothetical protein